ncbi:excinuclease ABC subunit UvrC [Erysipelothrix urinaevulpis]|uniref:excinuclease ABC subunit UvrC n=1 Tax=Erysipelothrix urinaevulpis TaxID=2683717 RepID=UPI0022A74436|nr:excinuclease ABC subunit UvrC [Erysipelothrix urinaevulpis]
MNQQLDEKLRLLPNEPGCYLMKNKFGDIIYVGKAKKLKQRVSSYFTGAHDYKTTKLVSQIDDFDIIITSTEKESLILEINLIKEHRPRFNILFMDDKSYPYLRLNRSGLPKVEVARDRKQNPKFYYFGPYPDATAARNMAQLLNETMPTNKEFVPNTQAIYHKFNRTELTLSAEEIETWRNNLHAVLNGNIEIFRSSLMSQMQDASDAMNFELAMNLKAKLEALDYIGDKQQVQFSRNENFDMFHYAYHQGYIAIVGLFVRQGRLLERSMAVEACLEEPDDALFSFIAQFYQNKPSVKLIYVPQEIDTDALSSIVGVDVMTPQRGKKRKLLDIAHKNAENQLEDQFSLLHDRQSFKDQALRDLEKVLDYNGRIVRIEIFDNSHIAGNFTVSSCVVYDDGEPNKNEYRRYRLQDGHDDLASMKEVLYRRYFRLLKEGKTLPDLILVDGGETQMKVAQEVLHSLRLKVRLAGLVKDDRHRTRALLTDFNETIEIDPQSPMFSLLVAMQDEVHRYVIAYHRSIRSKAMTRSILDEVKGIGAVRKKKLYNKFRSLKGMREASIEELTEVLPEDVAQELKMMLNIDWSDDNEN